MAPHPPLAAEPVGASPPAFAIPRWAQIALAVADPLSIAGLFVYMLANSWMRWMDPLIDFPRSLYVAWRLNEGDLLYEKVMSWYGPLPHLAEAAAFRVFGTGLDTIVWLNIGVTVGVLFLLRAVFRALGSRWMGWLGTMIFICVFAFNHYNTVANYNFITPYASQATYGFAGLLLVLWSLLRHLRTGRARWLVVAGVGWGIAYLDKPEPLLAATGAAGIYLTACFIRRAREQRPACDWRGASRWLGQSVLGMAGGFIAVWLPVFLFFAIRGGLAYALRAADWVPGTMLSGAFRQTVENSYFMRKLFGFDQPGQNFLTQLGAGGLLVLLCAIMVVAARDCMRQKLLSETWWTLLIMVLAAGAAGEWLAWRAGYFMGAGPAFVFPVWIAAVVLCWQSLARAWRGSANFDRVLGLAVVGGAAALMLARMILSGRLHSFGFFMMPLAVIFWLHLLVAEAGRAAPGALQKNWLLCGMVSGLFLFSAAAVAWQDLGVYAQKNYAVGEGRDGFRTFAPDQYPAGAVLETMLKAVQEKAPGAKTLVVFPEGIAVNYLLRVPSPLAELEFQPAALGYAGPGTVLKELKAHPPAAVMIFDRDMRDYGVEYFGQDDASGRDIVRWLNDQYQVIGIAGQSPDSLTGHTLDLLVPKTASGSPGLPLLRAPR